MGELSLDFHQRTVLITGAARGIGRALATFFHAARATVVMVDFDADEVSKAAAELGALAVPADVSSTEDVERAVATAVEATDRVVVLINNAGILRDKVVWKLSDDDWQQPASSASRRRWRRSWPASASRSISPRHRDAL